jgi:hypothetical protein
MVALTNSITIEAPPTFPYLVSIGLAFGDLVLGDTPKITRQIERITDGTGVNKAGDRKNSEVNKTELLKPCCRISFCGSFCVFIVMISLNWGMAAYGSSRMDGLNSIFRSTTLTVYVSDTNELTPMMHSLTHGADNVYLLPGPSCNLVCNVLNDEF